MVLYFRYPSFRLSEGLLERRPHALDGIVHAITAPAGDVAPAAHPVKHQQEVLSVAAAKALN